MRVHNLARHVGYDRAHQHAGGVMTPLQIIARLQRTPVMWVEYVTHDGRRVCASDWGPGYYLTHTVGALIHRVFTPRQLCSWLVGEGRPV